MLTILYTYRRWIIGSALLVAATGASLGAYRYVHSQRRETYLKEASHAYGKLVESIEQDQSISLEKATTFITQYSDTTYAGLLQLYLAKQAIEADELDKAVQFLQTASEQAIDPDVRCLARQRGARALAMMGRFKEALQLIDSSTDKAYLALNGEIKGNILHMMGDQEGAFKAYQKAYQTAPYLAEAKPLLLAKIIDLRPLSTL